MNFDPWQAFRFDVNASATEPDWLVDGLMARGTITMLSGDTSAGKSFVSLDLAMAVLEGSRTWLGRDVTGPGRVLVLENEMPAYDVEGRLRGFGVRNEHWERLAYLDKSQAVALDDPEQAQQMVRLVEAFAPDLVVLDTLFSLVPGIDHNSNGVAAGFYRDVLRPMARSTSLLLLHHENKPGEHGRGAAEYQATGARAWAHQADRHLTLAAVGDKQVKTEELPDGNVRGTYRLVLESGKTRGVLKPRLDLEIVTVADADGHVTSTRLNVAGERQPRVSQEDDFAARIVSLVLARDDRAGYRKEFAELLGVDTKDGRLSRALSSLVKSGKLARAQQGLYRVPD